MEVKNSKSESSKISPADFIAIVNSCLSDYYGNPSCLLGMPHESTWNVGKIKTKEDFEEYSRSRSFTYVFEHLIQSNHWHQAIDYLSNCVKYHLPQVYTVQKILDMMLVIDDNSFVMAAQMYLYHLISYHPPKSETLRQYYSAIFKEEKVEEKRVSSPKDPCGSFNNIIHQFATELEKMEIEKKDLVVVSHEKKGNVSMVDIEELEEQEPKNDADSELLDLCDLDILTGEKLRAWWNNATSEDRIDRLLSVFVIMMEIFYTDLTKCLKKSKSAQRSQFNRPILSRLVWLHGDQVSYAYMIDMIVTVYTASQKLDHFPCMSEFEKLINFIANILPPSPLDKGEGYPPDSHQRRVFAQKVADSLQSTGLDDDRIEIAIARLKPAWFRSLVGTKILNKRSESSCGDLQLNVAQLAQMIIQDLNWSDQAESDDDSTEIMDEEKPSSSGKGRRKKAVKRNAKGETHLHVLCRNGLSDKLSKELEKEGGNINVVDYAGWTALHEAVSAGHLECVKILLEYQPRKGIRLTKRKGGINSGRKKADQEPKELKTIVNLHAKGGDMGLTALHEAILQKRILIVDLLLKYGGSSLLNDTTKDGYTAFDLTNDEAMLDILHSHKKESRLVEKKFISDMKLSFLYIPKSKNCIVLHCMLLQACIETKVLMPVIQSLSSHKKKKSQKSSKSNALQRIDYLECSHDVKSLQSFIKCTRLHMKNKNINIPESCLIMFLC